MSTPRSHKSDIRNRVWPELRKVAIPDSRFHHDYSSFIADFEGSSEATCLILTLPEYIDASIIFIAPDNCLQELRHWALKHQKKVLMTTYGIRRGFWLLDPSHIPEASYEVAVSLDWMEKFGRHVTLREVSALGKIDMMVTGTGAINLQGMRFGKGHGYFDLEWAMLWMLRVLNPWTPTIAVVHECQVLDEELRGEDWDTVCDFVVTNERVIRVEGAKKPTGGILWDKLGKGMLEDIEPLQELSEEFKR